MTSGVNIGEPLTDPTALFWATSGPPDAPIVIVGEAWGSEERARGGRPFVGQSGVELDRILADAGLRRADILCTNIFNGQPEDNDLGTLFETGPATLAGLRPSPPIVAGVERLYRQLDAHPRQLIIAAGNYPLWALTNSAGTSKEKGRAYPTGITKLRGSQEWRVVHGVHDRRIADPGIPVLPIIHPTAILRQWSLRVLTVHDLRTRVPLLLNGPGWTRAVPYRFDAEPSFSRVMGQLSSWLHHGRELHLAADIETKGNRIITCIGIADSADYALCVPFVRLGDDRSILSYWTPTEEIAILRLLSALLAAPHIRWIGQNFLYDYQFIAQEFGHVPRIDHDTLVAQNLLFPGTPKDLGHLSSLYCAHHRYWKDDSREWATGGTLRQHLLYNCEDAARTWEIAARQREALALTGLAHLWPFELYKFNLAWRMMRRGVLRDPKATQRVGVQIIERKFEVDRALMAIAPQATVADSGIKSKSLWPSSPAQLRWLLYDLWGLPVQRDKKTKRPSTGKVALQTLRDRYPALRFFFNLLAESRSLGVIYANAIQARGEPSDGRIRGSFNPAGTETFRWSSSKNAFGRGMNMQNIPAGGEEWVDTLPDEEDRPQ